MDVTSTSTKRPGFSLAASERIIIWMIVEENNTEEVVTLKLVVALAVITNK